LRVGKNYQLDYAMICAQKIWMLAKIYYD
jgi:hypothetical protein